MMQVRTSLKHIFVRWRPCKDTAGKRLIDIPRVRVAGVYRHERVVGVCANDDCSVNNVHDTPGSSLTRATRAPSTCMRSVAC